MSEKIEPALTPEEWRTRFVLRTDDAMAHEPLMVHEESDGLMLDDHLHLFVGRLSMDLADRIEALLPPEEA